ncbi:hypothetical protein ACFE04_013778 [Oxalis oulophora]
MASMALSSVNGVSSRGKITTNSLLSNTTLVNNQIYINQKNQNPTLLSPLIVRAPKTLTNKNMKLEDRQWRILAINDQFGVPGLPLTEQAQELVKLFYNAINLKSTVKLSQIVSENCALLGLIVHFPYDGKQMENPTDYTARVNILNYIRKVMDAMGPNIRVVTKSISVVSKNTTASSKEEENLTASVTWQLEWLHGGKPIEIPLFSGTNEFGFEKVDDKLFIRTITGVEDFPVRPKDLMQEKMPFSSASLHKLLKSISAAAEVLQLKSSSLQDQSMMLLDILEAYTKNAN